MHNTPSTPLMRRLFLLWLLAILLLAAGFFLARQALLSASPVAAEAPQPAPVATSRDTPPATAAVPPFDGKNATHVLTAFSLHGMQQVFMAEPYFSLLPPGNVLVAQLLERGSTPVPLANNATVRYVLEHEAMGSAASPFSHNGTLERQGDLPAFVSAPIALLDQTLSGGRNEFPLVTVTAQPPAGAASVVTAAVLSVSTRVNCGLCHGSSAGNSAGIHQTAAVHILRAHDGRNNTRLLAQAESGLTVICRSCHGEDPNRLNLSTAMHGFHAVLRLGETGEACGLCHSAVDAFSRDIHSLWGLDCARCHGVMADHALSLLRHEAAQNKQAALTRMAQLVPVHAKTATDIKARLPWVNLPQCAGCHTFTQKPLAETASAFNKWTASEAELFSRTTDNTGALRCPSCHGPAHATYPASGPWGDERDNLQPLQYQNLAAPLGKEGNCIVCHKEDKDYFIHHERVE